MVFNVSENMYIFGILKFRDSFLKGIHMLAVTAIV